MNSPTINPFGFQAAMYLYNGPRTVYATGAITNISGTPINNISDGTLTVDPTKANNTIRQSPITTVAVGQFSLKYELTMFDDASDPNFLLLRGAWGTLAKISAVALSQAPTNLGAWGWASEWLVTGMTRSEKVEDLETVKFTLEGCRPNSDAVPAQLIVTTT